jgi:hypothetical protein
MPPPNLLFLKKNRRGLYSPAAMVVLGNAGVAAGIESNSQHSKTTGPASPISSTKGQRSRLRSSTEGQVPWLRIPEIIAIP